MQTTDPATQTIIQALERNQSSLLSHIAATRTVSSKDEQKDAEDLLIHARHALKDCEAARKGMLAPLEEAKHRINALFHPLENRLTMGIFILNPALQNYHAEEAKRAEEARLAAMAEQAAAMAQARDMGEIVEIAPAASLPEAPAKTSRTHLGTVTYREDFEVTIVNPLLVPRDLCDPNLTRIRARVKSGVIEIPGVLITKKYITQTRRGE